MEEDCYLHEIGAMDCVGESIHKSYCWVNPSNKYYFVMDNPGRHGTNDAINQYKPMPKTKCIIDVIFQIPISINVLDLGV